MINTFVFIGSLYYMFLSGGAKRAKSSYDYVLWPPSSVLARHTRG